MGRPLSTRQTVRWERPRRTALGRSPRSSVPRDTSRRFGIQVTALSNRPVSRSMRPGSQLNAHTGQFLGQPKPCMTVHWREESQLLLVVSPSSSFSLFNLLVIFHSSYTHHAENEANILGLFQKLFPARVPKINGIAIPCFQAHQPSTLSVCPQIRVPQV